MKNLSGTQITIISVIVGILFLFGIIVIAQNSKEEEIVTLPILVEEFSDFECPACASYVQVEKYLKEKFGENMNFVYRHFPLTSIHPNAYYASIASEASREQDMFEEFHNELFARQANLSNETYLAIATDLGLDVERFSNDLNNPEVIARVDFDIAEAEKRNLNSTPSFFVDGKKIIFKQDPQAELEEYIQARIDKANNQTNEVCLV